MSATDPRTTDEVFQSLRTRLENKIPSLTNFLETSFNYVFTRAFASEQHDIEVATTASQLSGWVEYSGKSLSQEDLDELGIDGAEPFELNEFMEPEHLDQLASAFGVERDSGNKAIGELQVSTTQATQIPEGREFGTQPDSTGSFTRFETTSSTSISSATNDARVEIQAVDSGTSGNVAPNTITFMPNPPVGVDSVTNPSATTGGEDEQTTAELREDVKRAVVESVDGGTTDGIESFIETETNAKSVFIEEKFTGDEHGSHPHADVVVLGGTDENVLNAIEFAHPSGIEHILERPDRVTVSITIEVEGTDITTPRIETQVTSFIDQLLIGEELFEDELIREIMNVNSNINRIPTLDVVVQNESHVFQTGTNIYELDKQLEFSDDTSEPATENGIINVSSNGTTFTENTDYREFNSTQSNTAKPHDSIDWSLSGSTPSDNSEFFVRYIIEDDITVTSTEVIIVDSVTVTTV